MPALARGERAATRIKHKQGEYDDQNQASIIYSAIDDRPANGCNRPFGLHTNRHRHSPANPDGDFGAIRNPCSFSNGSANGNDGANLDNCFCFRWFGFPIFGYRQNGNRLSD